MIEKELEKENKSWHTLTTVDTIRSFSYSFSSSSFFGLVRCIVFFLVQISFNIEGIAVTVVHIVHRLDDVLINIVLI